MSMVAAVALISAGAVAATGGQASAGTGVTQLALESFTGNSANSQYYLAGESVAMEPNSACLTAGTDTTTTPIPGCGATPGDAPGSGTLRLTSAVNNQVGSVFNNQEIPTTEGLDITFNSFQYGGTPLGADGISFILGAVAPGQTVPAAVAGHSGGSLGYAPYSDDFGKLLANGFNDGYLGVGLDAYGNFDNSYFDGTGCSTATAGTQSRKTNNLTVRGPGNAEEGYCILNTTNTLTSGTITGGPTGTRTGSQIPVEIAINPTATSALTASGITVPPGDYVVQFTPVLGSQQTLTGTLPSTFNGGIPESPQTTIPASWINPSTGIPYDLQFGWSGSTGGKYDVHEINTLAINTLNAPLPQLTLTDSASGTTTNVGSTVTDTLTPTVTSAVETAPVTVSETLPTGFTYTSSTGTGYTCTTAGQVVNCVYPASVTAPINAGTTLPPVTITSTPTAAATATNTITPTVNSPDNYDPANGTAATPVSAAPLTANVTFNGSLSGTVYNDATGAGAYNGADAGLANATVNLETTSGTVVATTTSGTGGAFSFPTEPAGTYNVAVTAPTGYNAGTSTAGTGGGTSSDPTPSTDLLTGVVITAGVSNTGNYFGLVPAPVYGVTITGPTASQSPANFSYTIVPSVTSGVAAPGITTVVDTLPASETFNGNATVTGAGYTCTEAGQTLTCTDANQLTSTSPAVSISVPVTLAAGSSGSVADSVTVSDPGYAGTAATATTTATATGDPQLNVTSTANKSTIATGQTVTYTVSPTNSGGTGQQPVTVTDTIPTGLTVTSATSTDGGTCTTTGQVVTCTGIPGVDAGSVVVTITATAVGPYSSSTLTDAPTVNSADNYNPTTTPATVGVATAGTGATLTLTSTLSGNVVETPYGDTAVSPAGITVTATPATGPAFTTTTDSTGHYSFSSLPAGTYTVSVGAQATTNPGPATAGTAGGTAGVGTITGVPVTAGTNINAYDFTEYGEPVYTLGITQSDADQYLSPGAFTYTLTPTIVSGAATGQTVVTATLPADVSFNGAATSSNNSLACTEAGQVLTCTISGTPGAPDTSATNLGTITVPAITAPGVANDTTETINGTVTEPGLKFTPGIGQETGTTASAPVLALASATTVNPTSIGSGTQNFVLTPTVTTGTETKQITLTETIPAGYTIVSETTNGWTCTANGATLTCTITPPAGGYSAGNAPPTITVKTNVVGPFNSASAQDSSTITSSDSEAGGNIGGTVTGTPATSTLATTISGTVSAAAPGAPVGGLTVTATPTDPSLATGEATTDSTGKYTIAGLVAGTYTVAVAPASGDVIVGATAGTGAGGSNGTADGTASTPTVSGVTVNYGGTGVGYDFSENTAPVYGDTVTDTDGGAVTAPGTYSYTVVPTITAGDAFSPIVTSGTLPAGVTLTGPVTIANAGAGVTASCSTSGGTFTCTETPTAAYVAGGTTLGTITVPVKVAVEPAGTSVALMATTTSADAGAVPGSATDPATTGGAPQLGVLATSTSTSVSIGSPLTITLTPSNAGGPETKAITLTDTLPGGVTIDSVSSPACSFSGQVVTCTYPAGGTPSPVTVTTTVTGPLNGSTLTDDPSINSVDNYDPGNDTVGAPTTGTPVTVNVATTISGTVVDASGNGLAGVTVTATGSGHTATAVSGTGGVFTITGLVPATTYTVSDAALAGYNLASATAGKGADGGTTTDGTNGVGSITAVNVVNGGAGTAYNFTQDAAPVYGLTVTDSDNGSYPTPGTFIYTVTPSVTSGVANAPTVTTFTVPAGLTIGTPTDSDPAATCTVTGQVVSCTEPAAATPVTGPATLGVVTVPVTVPAGLTDGTAEAATANVGAPTDTAQTPATATDNGAIAGSAPVLTVSSAGSGPAQIGGSEIITLTPTVAAGSETKAVTVTYTVPEGLLVTSATTGNGSCTVAGQVVTCIYPASPTGVTGTGLDPVTIDTTVKGPFSGDTLPATSLTINSTDNYDPSADTVGQATTGTSAPIAVATTISGSTGVSGVTVTASDGDGDSYTATSGTGGAYTITGLVPGTTYTVSDTPLTGYTDVTATAGKGADGGTTTDGTDGVGSITAVNVVDGGNGTGYNFTQETTPAGNTTISGELTNSVTGDGIGGVTVTATGPGLATVTTTTGTDGSYTLTGLVAGTYTVTAVAPAGSTARASVAGTGANGGTAVDGTDGTAATTGVVVVDGGTGVNYDFTEYTTPAYAVGVTDSDNGNYTSPGSFSYSVTPSLTGGTAYDPITTTGTLPTGETFNGPITVTGAPGSTTTCTETGDAFTCDTVPTAAPVTGPLAFGTITVPVTVASGVANDTPEPLMVTTGSADPGTVSATGTDSGFVGSAPVLTVSSAGSGPAQIGGSEIITLTPTVAAGSETKAVTVTYTVPEGLLVTSATTGNGSCTVAGQVVTCIYPASPTGVTGTGLDPVTIDTTVKGPFSGDTLPATSLTINSTDNYDPSADTVGQATTGTSAPIAVATTISGSTGVSGVTVTASDGDGHSYTATSGTGGAYTITGLVPGTTYTVSDTPLTGYTDVTATAGKGADGGTTTDGTDGVGSITAVNVVDGGNGTGYNFTQETSANGTIDGTLLDGSGKPVAGVIVTLEGATGTPVLVAGKPETTTSAANGTYSFPDIAPGTYEVAFGALPAGDSYITPASGQSGPITVTASMTSTQDATVALPGSVSGKVVDQSGNGIAGVTVTLKDPNGTVVATTTTTAGGAYSFPTVGQGSYEVTFGTLPTGDTYVTPSSGTTAVFTVTTGAATSVGATVATPTPVVGTGMVSGTVTNSAGAPVAGVPVTLENPNGTPALGADGLPVPATTTAADGTYSFPGVPDGTYVVSFGTPPGGGTYTSPASGLSPSFVVTSGATTAEGAVVATPAASTGSTGTTTTGSGTTGSGTTGSGTTGSGSTSTGSGTTTTGSGTTSAGSGTTSLGSTGSSSALPTEVPAGLGPITHPHHHRMLGLAAGLGLLGLLVAAVGLLPRRRRRLTR